MDSRKEIHQWVFQDCESLDGFAEKRSEVLKLPQFDRPFEVQVDTFDRALGGVLVQDKHPVASEGRKLKDAEMQYNTHEKEMTTVIHCLEVWRHYLLGTKFIVVTDNVANTYFKMQPKLFPKQARWQEFLREFDFEWVHQLGKHNDVVDALSQKMVEEYVASLTMVKNGQIRKYWLDSGLLYAKGGRAFVPTGPLRRCLLRETHDPQWTGHPGIEILLPLLARGFPKVNGMASIFVVVDHFSKYGIFMAEPHACPAEIEAKLFFKNVTKYFGVPQDIVRDRDTRNGIEVSTANHPQTNGQTERVNALLEDYLRHYVSTSQRNWVDLLDVATGMGPFELVYGQQPETPHEVPVQKTGGKCPAAYQLARTKQELFDEAKNSLAKGTTQNEKIWKKISYKSVHRGLIPKYDGPFEVVSIVGSLAYRLKLLDRLKIHPTFHVSFLKKIHQDLLDTSRQQTQRAPPVIRKEFKKTVLKFLDQGRWARVKEQMNGLLSSFDRPPNDAGMVRHSEGQSGRNVGQGARLWRARASCGLCANNCGRWLKDMWSKLDAARSSNTRCVGWQDVSRAGSPCTRPAWQTDASACTQHSTVARGLPTDARAGLDSQARRWTAVRWNLAAMHKAD
ncbi:UNVERIFIED_CONTAM: Transposon Ty3-I Gag-Pol polyprotein [Sesamum latifolium]|uniref:Transposon Ty3-I Gag-Pol polyprotein n=1 Tax=Sesamum latifolium TaxID=2727402 RepID=A0AAW2TNU0_9LAMI